MEQLNKNQVSTSVDVRAGYWTIGNLVRIGVLNSNSNYRTLVIQVVKVVLVNLSGYLGGNTDARAWAITDQNRTIFSRAISNEDLRVTPKEFTIIEDGFVYVNSMRSTSETLKAIVQNNFKDDTKKQLKELHNEAYYMASLKNSSLPVGKSNLRVLANRRMAHEIGIDFIIPTDTAIQNVRLVKNTVINGGNKLTVDGYHLADGTAKYIVSATLFYRLFSPVFNVPLLGNGAKHALTPSEQANPYSVAVTETSYSECQKAAFLAVNDMWNINHPETI